MIDWGENEKCVGKEISMDKKGMKILRRKGKIDGDVEFGGKIWKIVDIGIIELCLIRKKGSGINERKKKIM